jgi:hypothetical protein
MALTTTVDNGLVRAVALVGFYRDGNLVEPGQVLTLPRQDFGLHKMYRQVDYAPQEDSEAFVQPKRKTK